MFGALLSDPLRLGEHAYGTGECFLFTFYPSYRVKGCVLRLGCMCYCNVLLLSVAIYLVGK